MTHYHYRGIVTAVEPLGQVWKVTMRLPDYDMMQFTFFWLPERGAPPRIGERVEFHNREEATRNA